MAGAATMCRMGHIRYTARVADWTRRVSLHSSRSFDARNLRDHGCHRPDLRVLYYPRGPAPAGLWRGGREYYRHNRFSRPCGRPALSSPRDSIGIFRPSVRVALQHNGFRVVRRGDWRFHSARPAGAALSNENPGDAGYRFSGRSDRIRDWPDRLLDFGRWRLRHPYVAPLGHELPKWIGADRREGSPHANIRIPGLDVDWLYLVAYWSACCRRLAASRGSLRLLLDSDRCRALSGGVHSHQPACVFGFHECPDRQPRFVSRGRVPVTRARSKNPP